MKLEEVREEIHEQLGLDNVPLSFVFLRSVGRNFTQVCTIPLKASACCARKEELIFNYFRMLNPLAAVSCKKR